MIQNDYIPRNPLRMSIIRISSIFFLVNTQIHCVNLSVPNAHGRTSTACFHISQLLGPAE